MPEVSKSTFFGTGSVWLTPSKSRVGVYHTTLRDSEGNWDCSCEGSRYAGHCWHVDNLKEETGDDDDEGEIQVSLG